MFHCPLPPDPGLHLHTTPAPDFAAVAHRRTLHHIPGAQDPSIQHSSRIPAFTPHPSRQHPSIQHPAPASAPASRQPSPGSTTQPPPKIIRTIRPRQKGNPRGSGQISANSSQPEPTREPQTPKTTKSAPGPETSPGLEVSDARAPTGPPVPTLLPCTRARLHSCTLARLHLAHRAHLAHHSPPAPSCFLRFLLLQPDH